VACLANKAVQLIFSVFNSSAVQLALNLLQECRLFDSSSQALLAVLKPLTKTALTWLNAHTL